MFTLISGLKKPKKPKIALKLDVWRRSLFDLPDF